MANEAPTRRIEVAPATIHRLVLWTLLTVAAVWLLRQLWPILVLLLTALIVVGTINPMVRRLEARGLNRNLALLVVFLALGGAVTLLAFFTLPPLVAQMGDLVR